MISNYGLTFLWFPIKMPWMVAEAVAPSRRQMRGWGACCCDTATYRTTWADKTGHLGGTDGRAWRDGRADMMGHQKMS